MFKFKHVHAENFLSFHELDLELDNQGLVLIEGKNETSEAFSANGAGKSSVTSAIPWALYGKTPTGLSHDDIVNNITGKNTMVALDVEVDGVPHRIERYRKHSKHKNTVKLFREGKEITAKSVKDTDNMIQDLFKVDWNTFTTALFQGQGNTVTFANATDTEKKNILEGISGIAIYKKAQEIAKQKLGDTKLVESEITHKLQLAQQELTSIEALEQSEQDSYAVTATMIESDTALHRQAVEHFHTANYDQQIEQLNTVLADYNSLSKPEETKPSEDELTLIEEKEAITANLQTMQESVAQLEEAVRGYSKEYQAKVHEKSLLATSDTCRYCGSPLDNDHAVKEESRLNQEMEGLQDSIKLGNNYIAETLNPAINELRQGLQDKNNQLEYLAHEREQKRWADYHKQMGQYQELTQELGKLKNERDLKWNNIQSLERNLASLANVPKPKDRTEEKQVIHATVETLQQELLATNITKEQYEQTISMFSNTGIRSVVLDLITPFLNERANKYSALLSGADIEILFSTQTQNKDGSYADKFGVTVINNHGGEVYQANSGGEKKRIDLAISFAIQDLVMSKDDLQTNIALYDEIFESLDPIGCESVITLLQEKQKQIGSIFVITHNSALSTLFENTITIKKVNGVSHIVKK